LKSRVEFHNLKVRANALEAKHLENAILDYRPRNLDEASTKADFFLQNWGTAPDDTWEGNLADKLTRSLVNID
jgi:hypothetical protein